VDATVPSGAKDLKAIWASPTEMWAVGLGATILRR
jgi:hypothetical protein